QTQVTKAVAADGGQDWREDGREDEHEHHDESDDGQRVPAEPFERLGVPPGLGPLRGKGLQFVREGVVRDVGHRYSYLIRGSTMRYRTSSRRLATTTLVAVNRPKPITEA